MYFDFTTWFEARLADAGDPRAVWVNALIGESGYHSTRTEATAREIVDARGVLSPSMLLRPGLATSDLSPEEYRYDAMVFGEVRSLRMIPGYPLCPSVTVTGVSLEDRRRRLNDPHDFDDLGMPSPPTSAGLPETTVPPLDSQLDVYAQGRLLLAATDSVKVPYLPDYSVRHNLGGCEIWYASTSIAADSTYNVYVTRAASRRFPWTFYRELTIPSNRAIGFPLSITFTWDGWTKQIAAARYFETLGDRCSLWLVVQRPDMLEPAISLVNDWEVSSFNISHGEVAVLIADMQNYCDGEDGLSAPVGIETTMIVPTGTRIWFVLTDSAVDFEFFAPVRANGKEISLNMRDVDPEYLPSCDAVRYAIEIERAGDCPFIPPPIRFADDIEVFAWKSGSNGHMSDIRRLQSGEDWALCANSAVVLEDNMIPVPRTNGGSLYMREPVPVGTLLRIRALPCNAPGVNSYTPVGTWENWSSRTYTMSARPSQTNWSGALPNGAATDLPFVWSDNRAVASCWVGGLFREVEPVPDELGRFAHAKRGEAAEWCRQATDIVVRYNGAFTSIKDTILAHRDDITWSEWATASATDIETTFYARTAGDVDYFGSTPTDQTLVGEDRRSWNVIFGASAFANAVAVALAIDPMTSGSLICTVQAHVVLNSVSLNNRVAIQLLASTDHSAWAVVNTRVITTLTTDYSVALECEGESMRFRARAVVLASPRRSTVAFYDDTQERLTHPDMLLDRDTLASFQQVLYWKRTTEYELSSSDNTYDRQITPTPAYNEVTRTVPTLIAWDRLTATVVSPVISPNDEENGDMYDPASLELVYKDYYAELDTLDAEDGPGTVGSSFSTPIKRKTHQPLADFDDLIGAVVMPNYTTEIRWYSGKRYAYDVWTRTSADDYDSAQQWELRHYYATDTPFSLDCGSFGDTPVGVLDDGVMYEWNGQLYFDMTDFAIDDGVLSDGAPALQTTTPFPVLDCGTFPERV